MREKQHILKLLIISNTRVLKNRLQDSLRLFNTSKWQPKDDYSWTIIYPFIFHYNDKLHSTSKVALYRAMINTSDKELVKKVNKISRKMRLNTKSVSTTYPNGGSILSQITLKLLAKSMSFSSSKRITKDLNTGRMERGWKGNMQQKKL